MNQKIILCIIIFIVILVIINYYFNFNITQNQFLYKINKEGFKDNIYLQNQIRDVLDASSDTLDKINIFRPINKNEISNIVSNDINSMINEDDLRYNTWENIQKTNLENIEIKLKNLSGQDVFVAPNRENKLKSVTSLKNARPLNIKGLENGKYMINVNGKCLESSSLARTSIKPCNEENPKQYFDVEMIYTKNDYENNINTIGKTYLMDPESFKYPFNIIKSSTNGNCLTNNGSVLSVRPCEPNLTQQWSGSYDPIVCTYEHV
jgi:hypothetical protein